MLFNKFRKLPEFLKEFRGENQDSKEHEPESIPEKFPAPFFNALGDLIRKNQHKHRIGNKEFMEFYVEHQCEFYVQYFKVTSFRLTELPIKTPDQNPDDTTE